MALWGRLDDKSSSGTVSLNYQTKIVTGSGTSFGQVGSASTGDVIRFGYGDTVYYGDAIIVGIASTTQLSIASTSNLSGAAIANKSFTISELPIFTTLDSHYSQKVSTYDSTVVGISTNEMQTVATTQYDATHAGWVGVTTYIDTHGNLRVKSEVLVAMSSIEGDAVDEPPYYDAKITLVSFSATPGSSVGVGTTVTFVTTATVSPTTVLTYQLKRSTTSGGSTYVNVGVSTTNNQISIANTNTANNGFNYRVEVSASGVETKTTSPITLTVS
jgi:hypothetical protein